MLYKIKNNLILIFLIVIGNFCYSHAQNDIVNSIGVTEKSEYPLVITKIEQYDYEKNQIVDITNNFLVNQKLELLPSGNYLNIQFDLLNVRNPVKTEYFYRLKTAQENWISVAQNNLQLHRLPYGEHLIEIKAISSTGKKASNLLEFQVISIKPFYLQAWFLLLSSVLPILIGFFLFWQNKKKQQSNESNLQKSLDQSIYNFSANEQSLKRAESESYIKFTDILNEFERQFKWLRPVLANRVIIEKENTPESTLFMNSNRMIDILNLIVPYKLENLNTNQAVYVIVEQEDNNIYCRIEDEASQDIEQVGKKHTFRDFFKKKNEKIDIDFRLKLGVLKQYMNTIGGTILEKEVVGTTPNYLILLPIKENTTQLKKNNNSEANQRTENEEEAALLEPTFLSADISDTTPLKSQEQVWVEKMDEMIINNLDDSQFNTEYLASLMDLSRRQLHRKVKELTGIAPKDYIREKRLLVAKEDLEKGSYQTIKAIAIKIGFKDTFYFSKLYKDRFGVSPASYFNK